MNPSFVVALWTLAAATPTAGDAPPADASPAVAAEAPAAPEAQPATASPAAPTAATPAIARLLILDLSASGVDDALARNLTEVVTLAVRNRLPGVPIVGMTDVATVLAVESQKQLVGCNADISCLAEVGGALGADHMLVGSVGLIGEVHLLTLKLIRTGDVSTVRHVAAEVPGPTEKLIDAARAYAAHVVDLDSPADAEVLVSTTARLRPALAALYARAGVGGHWFPALIPNASQRVVDMNAGMSGGYAWSNGLLTFVSLSYATWGFVDKTNDTSTNLLNADCFSAGPGVGYTTDGDLRFAGSAAFELGRFANRSTGQSGGFYYDPPKQQLVWSVAAAGTVSYATARYLDVGLRLFVQAYGTRGDFPIDGKKNGLQMIVASGFALVVGTGTAGN